MTKMNNSKINNENKIMKNIGNKIEAALKAAGYTTSTFVLACAAEAEARRQAAAKAARKAAAVAAKKARDEERRAKDEARKAKAASRRTKKALADWKAAVRAETLANIKADVKAGKTWEAAVASQVNENALIKQTISRIQAMQGRAERALVRAEKSAHRRIARAEAKFKAAYDDRCLWFKSPEEAALINSHNEAVSAAYHQAKLDAETTVATAQDRCDKIEFMVNTVADPQRYYDKCVEVSKLIKAGYEVYCERALISSPEDVKELLSNWIIQYIDDSFMTGEVTVDAMPLKEGHKKPADIYRFVGTTLEECKAAIIKNVKANTAHWDSCCPYTVLSTRDLDLDVDDIVVDGEIHICSECGKVSSIMGAINEYGDPLTLAEYGKYFVNEDGEYIGVTEHDKCPECRYRQQIISIKEVNTVEELIRIGGINVTTYCKNCGAEFYVQSYHFGPVTYEITLKEGQVFVHDVSSKELCLKCATEYYGGGLDGVKDNITVNHGLWAFRKGENNVHGALQRLKDFLTLSETAEFCATEAEQFCGDFGVTIEHPEIKAAFDYTESDAWSERDEEDSDKRHATQNLHAGIKDKTTYDAAVEDHLRYGNIARQYVELIVRMGKDSSVIRMWVKEEFAVGHPHFFKALAEVAQEASITLYVLSAAKNDTIQYVMEAEDYADLLQERGLDNVVNAAKVEGETWGHFGLDEDRPWLRSYLFNLLVKRAEQVSKKDRKAVIVCGLPGSGKSTYVDGLNGYYTVDPDVVKWLLPEYNGGDASQVHKESCKIASWLTQYLAVKGFNIAIPMIGDNGSLKIVIRTLKECGYDISAHFVDTDPEECARRCSQRKRTMSVSIKKLQQQRQQIIENMKLLGLK